MNRVRSYLGLPPNAETLKLYKKSRQRHVMRCHRGSFGLDPAYSCLLARKPLGDIDNDGYLDMYLGTPANPSYASMLPERHMLHNKEGKFSTDVTASSGTGETSQSDMASPSPTLTMMETKRSLTEGSAALSPEIAMRFQSPFKKIHGGNSNELDQPSPRRCQDKPLAAIGARIKVHITQDRRDSTCRALFFGPWAAEDPSLGRLPLTQHIGLGKSAQKILDSGNYDGGPVSKTSQHFSNVAPGSDQPRDRRICERL